MALLYLKNTSKVSSQPWSIRIFLSFDVSLTRTGTFPNSDESAVFVAVPYDAAREREVVPEEVFGGAGDAETGVVLAVRWSDARQCS